MDGEKFFLELDGQGAAPTAQGAQGGMGEPVLMWMRPTGAAATLTKAAERLGLTAPVIPNDDPIIPPISLDFWGAVVLTYEAGRLVSIEKRELA